jgi:hypothetical protein
MSSTQQAAILMPGYAARRHRRTARHRSFSVHPVMEAVGWILAGAGIGSLAVVAVAWVLMRLFSIDDRASESSAMRGQGDEIALAVPARETKVPSYGM